MTIDGAYKLTLKTPIGEQYGTMNLKEDGSELSGSITNDRGTVDFAGGEINNDEIEFDARIPTPIGKLKAHVKGKVSGERFSGSAKLPLGSAEIEGVKVE